MTAKLPKMRILVTGDRGMVGTAFCNLARKHGHDVYRASAWGPSGISTNFIGMLGLHNPTHVLHLAARVGGVGTNLAHQADFAYENLKLATDVFDGMRWKLRVERREGRESPKLCSVLSTCVYPGARNVRYPLTENQIHNGPPDDSNYGYAHSKRMLDVLTRSHRDQYGVDWITVAPCNVYGEGDNFDLDGGHVIPALVHRFYLAKRDNLPEVRVWGSGNPLRQFVYAKDLARQLLGALEHYNDPVTLNLGTETEVSIRDLVQEVATATGYSMDRVTWDLTKPDGQFRKPASLQRLKSQPWWNDSVSRQVSLRTGIRNVVQWFATHYPDVRGGPKVGCETGTHHVQDTPG